MKNSKHIRLLDYEKTDWIFIGLIILLALWLLAPGLHPGRIMLPFSDNLYSDINKAEHILDGRAFPVGSDANLEFQPWNDYACGRLKKGEIPLWNPYNLCGAPFFANSLNQMTYIPRIIFSLLLAPENVITALALMHFLLCGIGFYYFLKAYKILPIAAGIATFLLLFKFSHPTVMMMPPQALTLAYMPVCLLLTVKLLRGGRWLWTLLLAICLSCIISSGYPIFFVHFLYLGLGLIVWEYFVMRKEDSRANKTGILKILIGLGLSILFSLSQLLPFIHLLSFSAFPPITKQLLMHFHFKFTHIIFIIFGSLASPFDMSTSTLESAGQFTNIYIGIIPVIIALPIYGQWRRRGYTFFIIATGAVVLLCFSTTLFHAAMKLVPGFGISPVPPLPALFFCLITAFAFSLDWICRPSDSVTAKGRLSVISLILSLAIVVALLFLQTSVMGFDTGSILFISHAILLLIGLLLKRFYKTSIPLVTIVIFVLFINLAAIMKVTTNFYSSSDSLALSCKEARTESNVPSLNLPRHFDATNNSFMSANINIYPRIRLVQGYDSLILKHYVDLYKQHSPDYLKRGRRIISGLAADPLLRETGAGKVIQNPSKSSDGHIEESCGMNIYVTNEPYLESGIDNGSCKLNRISPERMEVTLDVSGTSKLRIAETYYPAWRYRIDDEYETHPVRMGENGFMIIPGIPTDAERVEITYVPKLEKLGLILAVISFILGATAIWYLDRKVRINRA